MQAKILLASMICALAMSGAADAKPEPTKAKIDPGDAVRKEIKQLTGIAIREEGRAHDQATALKLAQRACDLAAQHFGKDSAEMISPEFTLGLVYSNHRDSQAALPHYERAWALAEKHANTKKVMRTSDIEQWLFKCYLRTGDVAKGDKLIAGTLSKLEKSGDYKMMQDIAMQYTKGGHCDQAAALMRRVVAVCANRGDPLLPVLQRQVMVLVRCRRFADAIPSVERKRDLLKSVSDRHYADCLNELGQLNDLAERFDKSAESYKEALRLYKKQGRDKFAVARTMKDYARVLAKLKRTKEADALNKEADELKFGKD